MQFALFSLLSVGLLAAATPTPNDGSCDTGTPLCCATTGDAQTSSVVKTAATLLGVDLTGITGLVGLTCNPITVIGVGSGANCAQQPVCCTGTEFKGLVNVGCTPISL